MNFFQLSIKSLHRIVRRAKSVMMKLFVFVLLGLCQISFGSDQDLEIDVQGASNSAGLGASLSIKNRLNHHLRQTLSEHDLGQFASAGPILIAPDFFYFSQFPQLEINAGEEEELKQLVINQLQHWQQNYNLILVGLLPERKRLTPIGEKLVAQYPESQVIFKNLEDKKYALGVSVVNETLAEFANNDERIELIITENFFNYYAIYAQESIKGFSESPAILFNDDGIHFNNPGQAHFINECLLRPLYNRTLRRTLTSERKLKVSEIDKKIVLEVLSDSSQNLEDLAARRAGTYILERKDHNSLNRNQLKIFIPNYGEIEISNASNKVAHYLAQAPDHEYAKTSIKRLSELSKIIQKSGKKDDLFLPLEITKDGANEAIIFDLTQAVFFIPMPLMRVENVYEGWGYDYWKSYSFPLFSGGGEVGVVPGTNYFFRARFNDDQSITLEWKIFSVLPGQESIQERLPGIPNPWGKEIIQDYADYPHLIYNLELKLID